MLVEKKKLSSVAIKRRGKVVVFHEYYTREVDYQCSGVVEANEDATWEICNECCCSVNEVWAKW